MGFLMHVRMLIVRIVKQLLCIWNKLRAAANELFDAADGLKGFALSGAIVAGTHNVEWRSWEGPRDDCARAESLLPIVSHQTLSQQDFDGLSESHVIGRVGSLKLRGIVVINY